MHRSGRLVLLCVFLHHLKFFIQCQLHFQEHPRMIHSLLAIGYEPQRLLQLQSFQELQNLAKNVTVVARQLRIFRATESRLSAGG